MSSHVCKASLFAVALVAQVAVAKPAPPSADETFAGQDAFLSVVASEEFVAATQRRDWETAKALMERRGIVPDPKFLVIQCLPPSYVWYRWQWTLVNGTWVQTWTPMGCIKTVSWHGNYFPPPHE